MESETYPINQVILQDFYLEIKDIKNGKPEF